MARIRFAVAVTVVTIAMSTMAITGCSSRNLGSNVRGEAASDMEMVAKVDESSPMALWESAIGAISWVVTLPFTSPRASAENTAEVLEDDLLESTFCHPVGEMDYQFDKPCFEDEIRLVDGG